MNIPCDLQAKLLLPLLTKKARLVTNRLSLTELDDYEIVKQRILTEFRLTSRDYLVRFRAAKSSLMSGMFIFVADCRICLDIIYVVDKLNVMQIKSLM